MERPPVTYVNTSNSRSTWSVDDENITRNSGECHYQHPNTSYSANSYHSSNRYRRNDYEHYFHHDEIHTKENTLNMDDIKDHLPESSVTIKPSMVKTRSYVG